MPSVLELAEICNASYNIQPKVDGWELLGPAFNFPSYGFFAVVFKKNKEYVMAYRGTDDIIYDGVSDLALAAGTPPPQYYIADKVLILAMRNFGIFPGDLTLTGHSLGGGLAAMVSARGHNIPVVTFNSPGMYRATTSSRISLPILNYDYVFNRHGIRSYMKTFNKVLHIRSEGDVVSKATGRNIIKKTRTVKNNICPAPEGWNPISRSVHSAARALCAHKMLYLLMAIRNIPEFEKDIIWG